MIKKKAGRPFGTIKNPVRTHLIGGGLSPSYSRWCGMKERCLNPNSHIWKYYGGRGITVCERWLGKEGFKHFYEDMGEPPKGMTLDRRENGGNYSPENCKWSTWKEQAVNRRPGGVPPDPKSLRNKAKVAGLPYLQVYFRIKRGGWTEERALSTPIQPRGGRLGLRYGEGYKKTWKQF